MTPPKPVILIVDDVKANARLLAKKLSSEYDCLTAMNGEDALNAMASHPPDLILLDVLMPGMDGFEVCRRIKDNDRFRHIPVVFITSLEEDADETRGLALGAADYIRKPFRMPIVKARIKNHIALKHALDLLEEQAFIDGLTSIPNRRRFNEILDKEWYRAMRNNSPLSLILMDIDYFKTYNDNYGHQKGDDCLRQVGSALKGAMKRSADLVARYGGEEFAAILPDTDSQGALSAAGNIKDAFDGLAIPHEYSTAAPHVTVSQGAATFRPERSQSFEIIIRAADTALYKAKAAGRNQVALG